MSQNKHQLVEIRRTEQKSYSLEFKIKSILTEIEVDREFREKFGGGPMEDEREENQANLDETDLLDDRSSFEEFNVVPRYKNNSSGWKQRKTGMGKWANNSTKSKESRKVGKVWKIQEREEKEELEGHVGRGKQPVPKSEVFDYEPSPSANDSLGLVSPPAKPEVKETLCIDNPAPPTAKYT